MDTCPEVVVLPILPSLDLEETLVFYRDRLGFSEIVHYDGHGYLIVRRPAMELHFWKTEDRSVCEASAVYVRGGGIDALHAEFTARAVPRLGPILDRAWGMREFTLHDPHGNLLRFGRAI